MTVFKGYMKILKKNIGLVIIYLVIFFSVAEAIHNNQCYRFFHIRHKPLSQRFRNAAGIS